MQSLLTQKMRQLLKLLQSSLFLLVFMTLGCSTLQGFLFPDALDKDAKVAWAKDLKMIINDRFYFGTAVVPSADKYNIKIYPAFEEIDRLQWRTCHRGGHADKAVTHGFWPWSKKQDFFFLQFQPRDIELDRACTLDFEALTKKRKNMSFGMVVFPDSRAWINLSATVECNGRLHLYDGTSVCQAPVQSVQRIALKAGVIQDERPNKDCPPMREVSKGVFEYYMPKDQCIYLFKIKEKHESGKYRTHKLITYGSEKVPPAEL